MRCSSCGEEIENDVRFCPKCGNRIQNNYTNHLDENAKENNFRKIDSPLSVTACVFSFVSLWLPFVFGVILLFAGFLIALIDIFTTKAQKPNYRHICSRIALIIVLLCITIRYDWFVNCIGVNNCDNNIENVEDLFNGNYNSSTDLPKSDVEMVLERDLRKNYPKSPREVLNFFTKIQKCYYNTYELGDNDLKALLKQLSILADEELLSRNSFEDMYTNLKEEIKEYKSQNQTIAKIVLDNESDTIYTEVDGTQYAKINCTYYLKNTDGTIKITERYSFKKNNVGQWKILGWEIKGD